MNVAVASTPVRGMGVRRPSPAATPAGDFPGGHANNSNNNSPNSGATNSSQLLLKCGPQDDTVDYDTNVTALYESIGSSDWDAAVDVCRSRPREAATWVVRYNRDSNGNKVVGQNGRTDVLWRFLPIHSACALNPPASFLRALLKAHAHGPRTLDDQGMLPLHYVCGAKCSREVLYLLLMSFPQAALKEDPNGMLPLHYLAQWGPREGSSEAGAIDMMCVATGHKVGTARDREGNTAEMLAGRAGYRGHEEVARKIREFARKYVGAPGGESVPSTPREAVNTHLPPTPSRGGSMGNNGFSYTGSFGGGGGGGSPRTPSRAGGGVNFNFDGEPVSRSARRSNLSVISSTSSGNNSGGAPLIDASLHSIATPRRFNNFNTPGGTHRGASSTPGGVSPRGTTIPPASGSSSYRRNNFSISTPIHLPASVRSSVGSSAPDRYASFNDDAAEIVDDSTLIEHEPEGSVEITLSDASRGANEENRDGAGEGNKYDTGLDRIDGGYSSPAHRASPRAGRPVAFSWDRANPAAGNVSSEARNIIVPHAATATKIQDTTSTSGSTWTTHVDLPASSNSRGGGSRSGFGNGAPASVVTTGVGPSSASQQRSNSTPRSYTPSGGSSTSRQRSSSTPRRPHHSSASSSAQSTAVTTTNSKDYASSGFPPLSPHKQRNQREWRYSFPESPPVPSWPQREEEREPPESAATTEQERQDQRLLELRDQLSNRIHFGNGALSGSVSLSSRDVPRSVGSDHYAPSMARSDLKEGSIYSHSLHDVGTAQASMDQTTSKTSRVSSQVTWGSSSSTKGDEGNAGMARRSSVEGSKINAPSSSGCCAPGSEGGDGNASVSSGRCVPSSIGGDHGAPSSAGSNHEAERSQEPGGTEDRARQEQGEAQREAGDEAERLRLQKRELQEEIARLTSERDRAAADRRDEEEVQRRELREEVARLASERDRAERVRSEEALLEEMARLREDKERAEGALGRITMMGLAPVLSMNSEEGREEENEDHDDSVSKLTFLENEEDVNTLACVKRVDRLLKMKIEIDTAIRKACKEASYLSVETEHDSSDDDDGTAASAPSYPTLRDGGDSTTTSVHSASQSEAQHQEVIKSLNESLDKANVEMERLRNREKAANKEADEFRAKEKFANERRKELESKLDDKEKEWKDRCSKLEEEVKDVNDRCWTAQNDEHKIRAQMKQKESDWEEQREQLEAEIKRLKEAGSKRFSVSPTTHLDDPFGSSSLGNSLNDKKQHKMLREEVKDLNEKCRQLNNEGHGLQALMKDKELQWNEERERLEAEISALKDNSTSSASLVDSDSIFGLGSIGSSSAGTDQDNEHKNAAMKMRLENAVKEAKDMRKFNSVIRKEHGETVAELEAELESERRGKTEALSQVVALQYQIATLKQDLEDAKEDVHRAATKVSIMSSAAQESRKVMDDMKLELWAKEPEIEEESRDLVGFMKLKFAEREAALQRQLKDTKRELQAKEMEIEESSRGLVESMKLKFTERERMMQQQLEAGLASMKSEFEERERALREDAEKSSRHTFKFEDKERESSQDTHTLETVKAKFKEKYELMKLEFKEREKKLRRELEKSRSLLDAVKAEYKEKVDSLKLEFKEKEKNLRLEAEKSHSLLKSIKLDYKEREMNWQQRFDKTEGRLRQLESENSAAHQAEEAEETYLQQIRDLRKKIEFLQKSDKEQTRDLRKKIELLQKRERLRESALQDKKDEFAAAMRELKSKYEMTLMEKENSFHEELRESKKHSEQLVRAQEESFLKKLRDAKKKEQEGAEREDALLRQIDKEKRAKDSFSDLQVKRLIRQKTEEFEKDAERIAQEKDEEFKKEVAKLQSEIKRLRKQSKGAAEDKTIVNELETQLLDCKKELDRQRRKQKSEINKLNNSMELQKSKEGRLQSHIRSLEKQITDMVNEYESRLQDAFHDSM